MAAIPARPRGRDGFHIAIICALSLEAEMVELMLDKDWTDDGPSFSKARGDTNVYTTGALAGHNVVLCHMPSMGGNNAATCATAVRISFPNIKIAFVVGVCGVMPQDSHTGENIMLGDCIISTAVTQYDFGRQYPDGFSAKTKTNDSLSRASTEIRSMMSKLRTRLTTRRLTDKLLVYLRNLQQREPDLQHPGSDKDNLFRSDYDHMQHLAGKTCMYCGENTPGACSKDCKIVKCDLAFTVPRSRQNPIAQITENHGIRDPKVYFGRIGSANMVVKAGLFRDKIAKQHDIIAFEMESSGVWEVLPTVVIKGACDYADSHKNKEWQQWAAAVAASCLKALLSRWDSFEAEHTPVERELRNESRNAKPSAQDATESDTDDLEGKRLKTQIKVLKKLNVSSINDRVNNIRSGHSATCRWLTEHESYLNWLNDDKYFSHSAILWIKGKAGSGKSTIMKYILTEGMSQYITNQDKGKMYQDVIVSFFFNARGAELEKTTEGLYRSLLTQLFTQVPGTQEILDDRVLDSLSDGFTLETLGRVLCLAIQWIGRQFQSEKRHGRVLCFIDALDECPEDQIRNMLRLFEQICDISPLDNAYAPFRLCFSSRYYPSISVKFCQHLFLEDQLGHLHDIEKYVDAELYLGSSDETKTIKADIVEKSGQIFLWVVLVVQMLKKEYDRGRIHAMRRKLKEIPRELNELFKDIILRDQDNIEELVLCIQWILYAKRPLSLDELYFAMLWGTDSTNSLLIVPWRPDQVGREDMQRYILNSSKGLAEFVYSDDTQFPRVQFIHESVREFFIKEHVLVNSWFEYHDIVAGDSHDRLKSICHQQVNSVDSYQNGLVQHFPFLEYAVATVMWHAEQACACGISQINFLTHLRLQHLLELTDKLRCDEYEIPPETSLLDVLAHWNYPHLITQELIRNPTGRQLNNKTFGETMYTALWAGNVAAAMVLLKPAPGLDSNNDVFVQAVNSTCSLIQISPPLVDQSPISWFDQYAPDELVHALLGCTDWVNLQACTEMLHLATRRQNINVVQKLLQCTDIQVNAYDYEGCTPLYIAARQGSTEIVQRLIASEALIENGLFRERHTESPLLVAARYKHKETCGLLLDHNADPSATDSRGRNALHLAGYADDASMVERLLEQEFRQGLCLQTRDKNGWLPLHIAASHGSIHVLDLLLSPMVSINSSTTVEGYTALHLAAGGGYTDIVQRLIEKKADIELATDGQWTPLHAAVCSRSRKTVQLLLEAGADVHVVSTEPISSWPRSGISEDSTLPVTLDWLVIVGMQHVRPIHLAILNVDLSMIDFLMGSGASLDESTTDIDAFNHPLRLQTLTIDIKFDAKHFESLWAQAEHNTEKGWPMLKRWLRSVNELFMNRGEQPAIDAWQEERDATTLKIIRASCKESSGWIYSQKDQSSCYSDRHHSSQPKNLKRKREEDTDDMSNKADAGDD